MKKVIITIVVALMGLQAMQGQVLITLVFGNMLNSPKLKFGLDGGANFSTISNLGSSKYAAGFNLGFYFDILLKKDMGWYVHTGVIVKSPLGTRNLDPYSLDNPEMDTLFTDGYVDRKLRYFNVPILVRYKFKWQLYAEFGPMLGLLYKANDVFYNQIVEKKDLSYTNKLVEDYKRIDAGIMGGLGYQLQKGNGMNFGIRYYYGCMDILKDNPGKAQQNSSFYLYASIPIGAGEKAKAKSAAREEKKKEKKEQKKQKKEQG
jgi:hypothetical protein